MLIRPDERIVFFGDSLTCRTDLLDSADPSRRYSLDYAGSYVDILVKRLLIHFPQLPSTTQGWAGTPSTACWRAMSRTSCRCRPR